MAGASSSSVLFRTHPQGRILDVRTRTSGRFSSTSQRLSLAVAATVAFLLSVYSDPVAAQQESAAPLRQVKAYKLEAAPVFDGRVDESWMGFEPAKDFI